MVSSFYVRTFVCWSFIVTVVAAMVVDTHRSHSDQGQNKQIQPPSHIDRHLQDCSSWADCAVGEHCEEQEPGSGLCKSCFDCLFEGTDCQRTDCLGCTQHEDCQVGEYCNSQTHTVNFCQACDKCGDHQGWSIHAAEECPEHCMCQSSKDCPDDHICTTQGLNDAYPHGFGLCRSCSEEPYGCVQDWLVGPSDSCQASCPAQYECSTHQDCDGVGAWCDKRHQCNECGPMCSKITLSGKSVDETNRWSYTHLPYDGGDCPDTCCDWGMAQENFHSIYADGTAFALVHPCNADWDLDIYIKEGVHDDASAREMVSTGNACEKTSFHNDRYFFFECAVAPLCQTVHQTIGMVHTDKGDMNSVAYVDDAGYPFTDVFSFQAKGCGHGRTTRMGSIVFGAAIFMSVLCLCLGVYGLFIQRARRTRIRYTPTEIEYPKSPWLEDDASVHRRAQTEAMFGSAGTRLD